jgi:hypothetical protein
MYKNICSSLAVVTLLGNMLLTAPASATSDNDTTTAQQTFKAVYFVGVGHSQYAEVRVTPYSGTFTCGGGNNPRISTTHPRYKDMLDSLRAVELSGGWVTLHWEVVSNQCWVKRVNMFMPGT